MKKCFIVLAVLLFSTCFAQTPNDKKILKIYVSGNFYDLQYLKEQIPVVDFVNDRKDADVHILVASESTGSGGLLNTILFYGQNHFDKMNDTIKVVTEVSDSDDITRGKLAKGMKNGLFNYLRRSGAADRMTVSFNGNNAKVPEKPVDPWDSWVFRTSLSGYINGEASSKYLSMSGSFSATRTTEDLRLGFSISNSYSENSYNYDIDGVNYDYLSVKRSQSLNASVVKSLTNHWSLGTWGMAYKSTYGNLDLQWGLSTGIEYNFFPYSESSQQQLRFVYKLGLNYNKYAEETIYFKEKEYLATQNASVTLDLTQPWGTVSFGVYGQNYFQDLKKYSLSFSSYFSVKLIKGLSVYSNFYYSKINNQLSLPRSGASVEDVLLSIRQLETEYSYYVNFGLSFSFGSIFNSIVNPRFGNSGGSVYYD